jgi:hypothetical protein
MASILSRQWVPVLLTLFVGATIVLGYLARPPALPALHRRLPGPGTASEALLLDESQVYAPQLLNLSTAWDFPRVTTDVVVAIIDSGINRNHPDFEGRVLAGYDFIYEDDDPNDENGHGTHVAGIVAAAAGNERGVAGVCGFCKILPVKIVTARGQYSPMGVRAGLKFAADQGAHIAVLSLGDNVGSSLILEGIDYALARGVFIVAAAGNRNSDTPFYPAAYDGVFAVSATDQFDQKLPSSNYGSYIAVSAPGAGILSTYHILDDEQGGYRKMSGTSMAAPFVAGLAALLLAQDPERTPEDLARLLTTTAADLGEPGWDPIFGHGRIDPVAALAAETQNLPPLATVRGSVWYDDNQNNEREEDEAQGLPWTPVVVRDQSDRIVGLTNTGLSGAWRWTTAQPGLYTFETTVPLTTVFTVVSSHQIMLTPPTAIENVNFGVVESPLAAPLHSLTANRSGNQVRLSWQVTALVRNVQIERATESEGVYDFVGSVPLTAPNASGAPVHFDDQLPEELDRATVYYRFQVAPGNLVVGPYRVEPVASGHTLFLPLVGN